jgi:hypothetical protein
MSVMRFTHPRRVTTNDAQARRYGRNASSLPSRAWICITVVLLLISLLPTMSAAQTIHAAEITSASQRFGIPEAWIRAVMRVESAGDRHAVSHRGAMGLMQVMPATWASLRAQHDLGTDPFAPQDNILAGTAYLREMLDRFGSVPLMLAAYNAGPRRVEEHIATGQPLPVDTRAYVAALAPLITDDAGLVTPGQLAVRAAPGSDAVFVRLAGATTAADTPAAQPFVGRSRAAEAHEADRPADHRDSMFAIRRSPSGAP